MAGARRAPASALRWVAFGGGSIAALGLVIAGATVLFQHGHEAKDGTAGTMPSAMASMLTAPSNPFEPSVSAPSASESPRAIPAAKETHRKPVVRTTPTRPKPTSTRPPAGGQPPVTSPPGKPSPKPSRTRCVLPSGIPCDKNPISP
ncbi:hypothetical protein GCM10029978_104370 [Actinoallomurus acanthiterrae]